MHVMIDLETWGTRPGCAIRSIGAVTFDPRSDYIGLDTFYRNISDESCEQLGLHRDPDTVRWWSNQSQEAQDALLTGTVEVQLALVDFNRWWNAVLGQEVWSQGANFDIVLMEHIYDKVGRRAPWKFWDTQDTRTAYNMAGLNTKAMKREGTYHNALDDAMHQARCVQRAYKMVRG